MNIELGRGGNVARDAQGAPHDDDVTDPSHGVGTLLDSAGDVGQRTQRHDRESGAVALCHAGDAGRRIGAHGRCVAFAVARRAVAPAQPGQAAEAIGAVDTSLDRHGSTQPARGALGEHGRGGGLHECQNPACVGTGELHVDVTRHRGHQIHRQGRSAQRQHQGQGIVDPRIGIDDDAAWGWRHRWRPGRLLE